MRRIIFAVLISLFIISASYNEALAALITLQPGPADGIDANWYSWPTNPNNANYGYQAYFEVRKPSSFQGRGLLKFNMPAELSEATITTSNLSLYGRGTVGSEVYINRATSFWEELDGELFTPPTYDSLYQTLSTVASTSYRWLDFDITDMTKFWVLNPTQNYGMVLEIDAGDSYWNTSDAADSSAWPTLYIEYESTPVPEPSTILLFGMGGLAAVLLKRRQKA